MANETRVRVAPVKIPDADASMRFGFSVFRGDYKRLDAAGKSGNIKVGVMTLTEAEAAALVAVMEAAGVDDPQDYIRGLLRASEEYKAIMSVPSE